MVEGVDTTKENHRAVESEETQKLLPFLPTQTEGPQLIWGQEADAREHKKLQAVQEMLESE